MNVQQWREEVEDRAVSGINRYAEASTDYERRKAVRINGSCDPETKNKMVKN